MVTSFPWGTSPSGAGRQIDGGRKLGQEVVRQIKIQIEARQIPALLLLDLVDVERGKDHAAFRVVGMGEWQEPFGEHPLVFDRFGAHGRELGPRHPRRECDPHTALHGFATDMVTPVAGRLLRS